jgi:hypothetical protein
LNLLAHNFEGRRQRRKKSIYCHASEIYWSSFVLKTLDVNSQQSDYKILRGMKSSGKASKATRNVLAILNFHKRDKKARKLQEMQTLRCD